MDPKIIKKTQDSLGKYIKKPPLTEKLLSKPPFRFLHDVATSVVKTTGFMKGLFTDSEMNSENVKERDIKVAFLQKVIDMVSLVLGNTLSAKPTKVVAGQEPEKTNELLQALAQAIGKKINNADYVKRVLKGEDGSKSASASKKEPEKKKKERDDDKDKDREERKHRSKGDREKSRDREEKSGDRDKARDKDRHRDRDSKDRDKEKSRDKDRDKHRDRDRDKDRDRKDRDKDKSRDKERSRDRRDKDRDRSRDKERESSDKHKDRERKKHREEKEEKAEEATAMNGEAEQEELPPRIPRPNSAKGSRRRHGHEEEHIRDREREKLSQNREAVGEDDLPPQVANARKMQRPGSARPAPPRVKKNEGQEDLMIGSSNVPNLITDKDDSDDDEDNFITNEDDEPLPLMTAPPPKDDDDDEGAEHGGLVKRILETKKELEGGSQQPGKKTEIERSHVSDATRRKEREMVQKEIDKLRNSIQILTRSVNPLGKILDFVQEDLDSMQKELVVWQEENKENYISLQREQSITESSIEPLKAQLLELEAATGDQLDLIAAVKHNILKNEDKIEKMLSTVTKS